MKVGEKMNPISQENPNGSEDFEIGKEPNATTSTATAQSVPPKRTYTKREKKAPTIATLTKEIEAKNLEIEAIQADIKGLMTKRNELFFLESVDMGLMAIVADPEKAKLLARFVKESQILQNQ